MEDENAKFIGIIMRQTTYSHEEAKKALEENDNNYVAVIRGAFGINKANNNRSDSVKSINQDIYKNIRELMDGSSPILKKNLNGNTPPASGDEKLKVINEEN